MEVHFPGILSVNLQEILCQSLVVHSYLQPSLVPLVMLLSQAWVFLGGGTCKLTSRSAAPYLVMPAP